MEPVTDDDITTVLAPIDDERFTFWASCAWSSGCDWYFISLSNGIALFNTFSGHGWLCRKRSWMFFDAFLKAPPRRETMRVR